MKKIVIMLTGCALMLPNIANACYLTPHFPNIFLSGLGGLILAGILILIIRKKTKKLIIKNKKYYLIFIPMYIITTIVLVYISILLTPLNVTTITCGTAANDAGNLGTFSIEE